MNDCTANDIQSKLDEITKYFNTELRKVKTELQSAKETSHLNMIHFNGQMKNVSSHFDTALKNVKTELKESKEILRVKNDQFDGELKIVKSELKSSKETLEIKTDHFEKEIEKLKIDLKASKEMLRVQSVHFNWELRKVKTELRSSKTNFDQLQRENARLKENLENASKIQDNLMSKIENLAQSNSQAIANVKTTSQSSQRIFQASLVKLKRENVLLKKKFETVSENLGNVSTKIQTVAQSSSKEQIFFDYYLGHHMTSTGEKIVKFDRPMAVSATKIYDESTGKVTIKEDGLYYFYVHGYPYEKSRLFDLYIYVDDEDACGAYKKDGTRASLSCAIVRHLKRGQQIYITKYNKLYGSSYQDTGFLGFKLQ